MNKLVHWLSRSKKTTWPIAGQLDSKVEKKSGAMPLIALHGLSEASWCDTGYLGLAKQGYLKNPVVHRCVKLISESAASIPLLAYEGKEEMDTHPLLELLKRPNSRQSGIDFLGHVYSSLLISGNAYLLQSQLENVPKEIHCLRADRMQVVHDEFGWPTAYDHSVNGRKQRYEITDVNSPVAHISLYNPLDDFEGVSPLASAHMALDIHNAANRWNKALLDNSARPSGALVYNAGENANLTDEQFDRLKAELESGYSGAAQAGRPMVLEGGLDWKQMGFSPKDMDFMEARNGAARDIALAFGVPPMLLGIPGDNTYSNYKEANLALWRLTILPVAQKVTTALQNWLAASWSPTLRIDIDRDKIDALTADRDALWKRVNEATFITPNEKRIATGYGALANFEDISDAPANVST